MSGETVPLFPLGTVLLPGQPLPLRIFEPRYRQLLADVSAGPQPRRGFGVVALERGVEVGPIARPDLAEVGTMAEILDVRAHQDGTADLLLVGSRRFRIRSAAETPAGYLQADVDWLGEREGAIRPGDLAAAERQLRFYRTLLSRLFGQDDEVQPLPGDPVRMSYALAERLFLPPADRQQLLAADTAADRIRTAMALLRRETVLLRATRSVPAPFQSLRQAPTPN